MRRLPASPSYPDDALHVPRVTAVVPIFNREAYVGAAIESLLAQTFTNFEIVAVDDASSDGSVDVVRRYRDPRIRIAQHERNRGIGAARNTGISLARGRYVALLDSDDTAVPERFRLQVDFLDHRPECAAVSGWVTWIDAAGMPAGGNKATPLRSEVLRAEALFRCPLRPPAVMARTELLRAYPFSDRYRTGVDFDLWSRIAEEHEITNLPRILGRCRHHADRSSQNERIAQRASERREIDERQLRRLGVAFDNDDLERHIRLVRLANEERAPDVPFVEWADRWLRALGEANVLRRRYPEPFFHHALRVLWLTCCWHSRSLGSIRMLQRWRHSPLSHGLSPVLRHNLWIRTMNYRARWLDS